MLDHTNKAQSPSQVEIQQIIAAAFWDFYRMINAKVERYTGKPDAFNWAEQIGQTCVFIEELMEIAVGEDHNLQYIEIQSLVDALKQEQPLYVAVVDLVEDDQTLIGNHHLIGFLRAPHHHNSDFSENSGGLEALPSLSPEKNEGGQERPNIHDILAINNKNSTKTISYLNH